MQSHTGDKISSYFLQNNKLEQKKSDGPLLVFKYEELKITKRRFWHRKGTPANPDASAILHPKLKTFFLLLPKAEPIYSRIKGNLLRHKDSKNHEVCIVKLSGERKSNLTRQISKSTQQQMAPVLFPGWCCSHFKTWPHILNYTYICNFVYVQMDKHTDKSVWKGRSAATQKISSKPLLATAATRGW